MVHHIHPDNGDVVGPRLSVRPALVLLIGPRQQPRQKAAGRRLGNRRRLCIPVVACRRSQGMSLGSEGSGPGARPTGRRHFGRFRSGRQRSARGASGSGQNGETGGGGRWAGGRVGRRLWRRWAFGIVRVERTDRVGSVHLGDTERWRGSLSVREERRFRRDRRGRRSLVLSQERRKVLRRTRTFLLEFRKGVSKNRGTKISWTHVRELHFR